MKESPDDGVAGAKVLCAVPDGSMVGLVQNQANSGEAFDELRTGLDHLAFTVPAAELDEWSRRLADAGVGRSPPAR